MTTVLITIHIMLVLAMIVLVLLQRSEGGALGMGGGGGGGGGFMSARGAANALTRTTTIIAAGFFLTSIALGVVANQENRTENVLQQVEGAAQTGVPTDAAGEAKTPNAGSLLDDLKKEGEVTAPSTGVRPRNRILSATNNPNCVNNCVPVQFYFAIFNFPSIASIPWRDLFLSLAVWSPLLAKVLLRRLWVLFFRHGVIRFGCENLTPI